MFFTYVFGIIIGYVMVGGFAAGIASRIEWFDGHDGPPIEVAGLFWPITIVVGISYIAFCFGKHPFKWMFSLGKMLGINKSVKTKVMPVIKIEPNAVIDNSEQYRQMSELVKEYEKNIPVMERR